MLRVKFEVNYIGPHDDRHRRIRNRVLCRYERQHERFRGQGVADFWSAPPPPFAGASPLAVLLAVRQEGGPSTTLDSMDLFSAGGLVVLGVMTSSVIGKFVPTATSDREKLTSR